MYIGKKGHPEAEGAISIDEKRIHLITNIDDLKTIDPTKKYVMTNQTTMFLIASWRILVAVHVSFSISTKGKISFAFSHKS